MANKMIDELKKLALRLADQGPVKTLPTPRKVQILFGGIYIVRTTSAHYVWEHPYYPQFYIPKADLLSIPDRHSSLQLTEGETFSTADKTPIATQYTLTTTSSSDAGGKPQSTDLILAFHPDLPGPASSLSNLVRLHFGAMDQWFEEDQPIHVHPKDPFKRIDILPSTREIKISLDGHLLAHTHTSMHLYETGLPCRFYLPFTSVDASVLRPSATKTKCPYKGEAEYYDVVLDNGKTYEAVFWYYVNPTLESSKIEGLLCPYNERVDVELDGVLLERPQTPFSKGKPGGKPLLM